MATLEEKKEWVRRMRERIDLSPVRRMKKELDEEVEKKWKQMKRIG